MPLFPSSTISQLYPRGLKFPAIVVSRFGSTELQPRIGLEIHAQLSSRTKLFSDSMAPETTAHPCNSLVSYFDMAAPGTLPRLNKESIKKSILAAVLLNCELSDACRFDRKHYFYPDLPLGYQITQKVCPIATNGHLSFYVQKLGELFSPSYEKKVRIHHLQLEIDSGKTVREEDNDLIDLNRAGLSLVEIVTAPDFHTSAEAACFVEQLRILLAENNICRGQLTEGHLRVDVNVSISVGGRCGKKTELKNMCNILHIQDAIDIELERQIALLRAGGEIEEETRVVDPRGRLNVSARSKGGDTDYMFIPEPNLPPLRIDPEWVLDARRLMRTDLPHLCYIRDHGFPPQFAFETMRSGKLGTFMHNYTHHVSAGQFRVSIKHFFHWYRELEFICEKLKQQFPPSDPDWIQQFAHLIFLNEQTRVTRLICIDLLKELCYSPVQDPIKLLEQRDLWQITDIDKINSVVDDVFADNPKSVGSAQKRQEADGKAFARLRRAVVARSMKRIATEDIDRTIKDRLGIGKSKREEL